MNDILLQRNRLKKSGLPGLLKMEISKINNQKNPNETLNNSILVISISVIIIIFFSACDMIVRPYQPGDVLLADDFSNNSNHWELYESADGSAVAFFQGGILVLLNAGQSEMLTTAAGEFSDSKINVTAEKISGSNNNMYGIICRYLNDKNYYGFLITADGYYGIFKVLDGNYQLLNAENLQYSDQIRQGESTNQLEVICRDNQLEIKVNGSEILSVKDQSFLSGKTGLFAGTYQEKNTAVLFDNYVVTFP